MSHKQEVEKAKRDAYQTPYEKINRINLWDAYRLAISLDPGLPKPDPGYEEAGGTPTEEELQRALVGLARRIKELEHEWS